MSTKNYGMELRQLRYFVSVAKALNFSEAARTLCITQSTLSQQIKQLEQELEVELFERNSHSVSLTENGWRLLPLAEKTLQDAKSCKEQMRDLKNMISGELIIGATYSFCPILTETLRNFLKEYPGVKLRICSHSMEELLDMLKKRELDIVLSFKPNSLSEYIESHTLFVDSLSVILRRDHPLSSRRSLSLDDLRHQSVVLPAKGLQARSTLERIVDIARSDWDVRVELNEVNMLLDVVESSEMITFLSNATIFHRPALKAISLDVPQNRVEGCVHILKKSYRKRSAEVFLKMLSESNEVNAKQNKWE